MTALEFVADGAQFSKGIGPESVWHHLNFEVKLLRKLSCDSSKISASNAGGRKTVLHPQRYCLASVRWPDSKMQLLAFVPLEPKKKPKRDALSEAVLTKLYLRECVI